VKVEVEMKVEGVLEPDGPSVSLVVY